MSTVCRLEKANCKLEGKVDNLESCLRSMMNQLAVDLEAKMSSEIAEIKKLQTEVVELKTNKRHDAEQIRRSIRQEA